MKNTPNTYVLGVGKCRPFSLSHMEDGKMVANADTVVPEQSTPKNWAPTAKVSVGILAASITTLLLPLFKKLTNSDLEATQATALTTLISFTIQYLVPERK